MSLRDEIFFGNIVAEADGAEINIDSRPSDAIALAVRVHVPIFVHQSVMDEAGIVPDKDMGGESQGEDDIGTLATTEEAGDRLSIFEDFIDQLDLGKLDDKGKDKPNKGKDKPDKGKDKPDKGKDKPDDDADDKKKK